jgi:simple sugar transport system permease protein
MFIVGVNPFEAFFLLFKGSLGSPIYFGHVLKCFIPLTLCATGLIYTFKIKLWNIGIESQIIAGALLSMAVFRLFPDSSHSNLFFLLSLLAGFSGGAFMAIVAGFLKNRCGVNEIFAGLGLNFVCQGLALYLIFGPWKRPGIASMSGTDPISDVYFLSEFSIFSLSPFAVFLLLFSFFATYFLIRISIVGLKLHASGENPFASRLLGLRPSLSIYFALSLCGGMAGLAGFFQVTGIYHRMIPTISSGYGYTAILVVLLSGFDIRVVPFVSLFFSCLNVGGIQLPMVLQVDSSLSGVIQGVLVVIYLLFISIKKNDSLSNSFSEGN